MLLETDLRSRWRWLKNVGKPDIEDMKLQVEKRRSVPVVSASLNLVAQAKAFPLRKQNKPSIYKTKWVSMKWMDGLMANKKIKSFDANVKVFQKVLVLAVAHELLLFHSPTSASLLFYWQLHWCTVGNSKSPLVRQLGNFTKHCLSAKLAYLGSLGRLWSLLLLWTWISSKSWSWFWSRNV